MQKHIRQTLIGMISVRSYIRLLRGLTTNAGMWSSDSRRLLGRKSHDVARIGKLQYDLNQISPWKSFVSSATKGMRAERSELQHLMNNGITGGSVVN